ncbi:hypothetical protein [Sphingomonas abietis]|uniref:Glycerophosphoryl diester phosphodiesterase membrane domain-containing protein n=1 Tax=Sphingomonas abietis TaxID=3012344 RepID=A0ABY7NS97_9SPHN|nr:hypothetical protein [Sphingomonas abietis]WBO24047.1 hypothetical protein PBT88_08040 [Sphingomonas abietis]
MGTALITVVILLGGPLVTLGIWLWLRSRRAPVALIEPLDLGEVLAKAFSVFMPAGWPLILLAAVLIGLPQGAYYLLVQPIVLERTQAFATTAGHTPNPLAAFQAMMSAPVLTGILAEFLLASAFYVAAFLFLVRRFEGRPITIGAALAATPARLLPAFGVALLGYIGVLLGMVVFILPGIILILSWCVVVPVLVCEDAGWLASFSRSRWLTIGSRGRILALLLLVVVTMILLMLPTGALTGVLAGHATQASPLFPAIWHVVFGIVMAFFQAALLSALYVELRRIKDGTSAPSLAEVFA